VKPRFDNKVTLVTGGASGIGKAIAWRLASEGARVVITDVQEDLGQATAAEFGAVFLRQDVCDEEGWNAIVREIESRYGHFDILINNAGIFGPADAVTPENTRLADWRRIFAVNVEGAYLGCRAAIPAMRRAGAGAIVNVSSVAALIATPFATAYGASKAAVRHLTVSVAQYCCERGLKIRCNSVHPGSVHTPMWDQYTQEMARRQGVSAEVLGNEVTAKIPMGDPTQTQDIAAAVAFLGSDDARHITGEQLIVDGGIVHCGGYSVARGNANS